MSAICGIFYRNKMNVNYTLLKKMNKTLSHRGPDGSNCWCQGSVGLGHQMLQTTPESVYEKLPFSHDDELIITSDARIDNREELIKQFDMRNHDEITDSKLILKAYLKWGENCPEKLVGDFAFAIWDKKEGKLFCARDHLGVKPFYYYITDDMFLFSTEIKAFFSIPDFYKKINKIKIGDYLVPIFDDKEITFYKNVLRLPNANTLSVSNDSFYKNLYWDIESIREIELDSDEEYLTKFKEIFFEAVKCRLRSKSNVGSMLSGGLDSSSIVCTAKILESDLKTFSAVFNEVPQCDEREYIEPVLNKTGYESILVHADKISPLNEYKKIFWHFDQPFYSPNLFLHWAIYGEARKKGINIMLDGLDGDTTVSHGNLYLADLLVAGRWVKLIQEIMALSKRLDQSILKIFLYKVLIPVIPEFIKYILKKIYPSKNDINNGFIRKEFSEDIHLGKRYTELVEDYWKHVKTSQTYHKHMMNSGILQHVLEILDTIGGSFDIEPRCPFFDKNLVEFCLALPPEYKFQFGWDRIILRRSMENILPKKVQWRKLKSNLAPNFERSFRNFEKEKIFKILCNENDPVWEYVNINMVRKSLKLRNTLSAMRIWKSLTLDLWLKYYSK